MTKSIKVGILGLGTVGSGLIEMIHANQQLLNDRCDAQVVVKSIAVRDLKKVRSEVASHYHLTDEAESICCDPEIDVIVELIGGIEPAKTLVATALEQGMRVVTANKALMAEVGCELFDIARQKNVAIYFEAAVAGCIPIIDVLHSHLFSDVITQVQGILNGTSHFILSEMLEKKADFQSALEKAQKLGYAESDPTHDVELIDATHKLAIIAELAFGQSIDWRCIPRQGIAKIRYLDMRYAAQFDACIKPVAFMQKLSDHESAAYVEPMLVATDHHLASCHGVMNAVYIKSQHCDESFFVGPGAGAFPTATSVFADLVRACCQEPFEIKSQPATLIGADANKALSEFYIRIIAKHEVGSLAKLTEVLSDCSISIKEIHQNQSESTLESDEKLIVIRTEPVLDKQIASLSDKLNAHFPEETRLILRILGSSN